ncbi:heparan-alpha-glucosaminide N-acetyltransferase isoform X1 [Lepeophtheirus salmonis]|uniref:heparan-alpha-glucosaminide N-acetyltransferase isoform X1 n=2 Tax=Lepeophtheirus salmonis TaxID=72036 RepID=UPI001AE44B15|nr:heparan-alpha-glucosaminide N-acetyltransferase-like [Lepeophtheirus salmonis]
MFFDKRPKDNSVFEYSKLKIDECYVNISAHLQEIQNKIFLYALNKNCHGCPLKRIQEFKPGESKIQVFSTQYPWDLRFRFDGSSMYLSKLDEDPFKICDRDNIIFNEFGEYNLALTEESPDGCIEFEEIITPKNSYSPLYLYIILILLGTPLYFIGLRFFNMIKKKLKGKEASNNDSKNEDNVVRSRKKRVVSLDVFRGLTIALMIFVNDGGGHYYFMEHSTWNGLYVADLAFPWFMWIMGFCIPISLMSLNKRKIGLMQTLKDITRRSVVLFFLGLFWGNAGWIDLDKIRIPGVLQRFGICYFIVGSSLAFLFRYFSLKDEGGKIRDISNLWPRWIFALLLMVLHTLIIFLFPVPGCPTGYLGPGGLNLFNVTRANCIGGATGYIDRLIFTVSHIYSNPTAKHVYESNAFDPEGFLGTLTSAFQVFLGAQGGFIILSFKNESKTQILFRLLAWGLMFVVFGGTLCGFTLNDGWIPINKNLWSLSYVFITTGLAFILLSILYFIVDMMNIWNGGPFIYGGMNSILLYLGHSTAWNMLPFHFVIGTMNSHFARLTEALWGVSLWLFIAYILHKKSIYITV